MDILPSVLTEIFRFGEVKEVFFNSNDLPLDRNHSGVVWRFCFTADYFTRSRIVYHSTVIAKNIAEIQIFMDARRAKETKTFEDSNDIIEMNKDCENKIIDMVIQVVDVDLPELKYCCGQRLRCLKNRML